MNKKVTFIFLSMAFSLCIWLLFFTKTEATISIEGIENFPSSYQPYLKELVKKHPNWKFIGLDTQLDWNYVIEQENVFGKNLVPKNYSDSWKNTTPGQYDVEVDGGWVDSSKQAVEYCMDPRNFLNEIRLFQFETLSYDANSSKLDSIEKILYGTEFYEKKVSYLDNNGNTIHMNETYSELILKGGQTASVSPYHLASRIKQEVGPFLSHSSISGIVEGYKGLYNFYNIGATSSTDQMGAIKKGLQYAKDGNGASQETKNKYLIPWNTKEKAITGGGIFIGSSYIHIGQNTIYLQKFHVSDTKGGSLFWHQYMTNILAPYSESRSIYNGYEKTGILSSPISFVIPIYNNMPEIPTESPNIQAQEYIEDNTNLYCTGTNVNVRTGPGTSYEILTMVTKQDKMTRIKKSVSQGERWDKVVLENGMIGYIFQEYVQEIPNRQIEKIDLQIENTTLQKGDKKQLQITILPVEASTHKVNYISSNPGVATIDNEGNITAIHAGTTIITVKAEENDVQNEIEITVYSPITGISIDQKELYMQIGDTFQINAYVEPEDASNNKIIYVSDDEKIATIDKNGRITTNQEGETTIRASAEENSQIEAQCKLVVVRKMEDSEIHFDSSLHLDSFEISGIAYNENTAGHIKEKITTDLEIEIVDAQNKILEDTQVIGTGSKVHVKENGIILRQYNILIYGDVNGDGKISSIDLLVLQRHILQIEEINGIYKKAANIRKDGKKPTSIDLLLIQRHILGLQTIEQ